MPAQCPFQPVPQAGFQKAPGQPTRVAGPSLTSGMPSSPPPPPDSSPFSGQSSQAPGEGRLKTFLRVLRGLDGNTSESHCHKGGKCPWRFGKWPEYRVSGTAPRLQPPDLAAFPGAGGGGRFPGVARGKEGAVSTELPALLPTALQPKRPQGPPHRPEWCGSPPASPGTSAGCMVHTRR